MNKSKTDSAARKQYDIEYRRNRMFNSNLDCVIPPASSQAQINGYRSWFMRHDAVIRWRNINWAVRFYITSLHHAHARGARLSVQQ